VSIKERRFLLLLGEKAKAGSRQQISGMTTE
jgi:hypothetical protein